MTLFSILLILNININQIYFTRINKKLNVFVLQLDQIDLIVGLYLRSMDDELLIFVFFLF